MSTRSRKYGMRAVGALVICVIYALILRQISFDFSLFQQEDYAIKWIPVIVATGLMLAGFYFRCLAWRLTFREFDYRVTLCSIGRILALSNLGRYIPGKIATVGGVLYLSNEAGVPPRVSGTALFINLMIPLLTAAMAFGSSLLLVDLEFVIQKQLWGSAAIILLASVVVLQPPLFNRIVPNLYRRLRKAELGCQLSYRFLYANASFTILSWAMQGGAYYLVAHAIFDVPLSFLPLFIGGNAMAFVIGLVSVFAPAGLGVKEGVLYLVLVQVMLSAHVAILVMLWRLYTTAVELLLAGVFFIAGWFGREHVPKQ